VPTVYTQALLDRARAYVEQPLAARRYDLAELAALYSDITGQAAGTCRQCQYKDFLEVVNTYIREATRTLHPELMADSKYTFAPAFANEQIADDRYNKVVKAENLTDKDAEKLISLGYGHVIQLKAGQTAATSEGEKPAVDTKAADALKAEKVAHTATKKELSEAKKQITELEKQVAELTAAATSPAPTGDAPNA
jgi:polyhydroxyalkanoate synthesis regulator phasin